MTPTDRATLRDEIRRTLLAAGLDAVGVASVEPFDDVRRSLEDRRERGFHGGMAFTFTNPRRSTEPARLLRNAASMVVGARSYLEPRPAPSHTVNGRVARYAWRDHYADLRAALDEGAALLRGEGHRAMVITDQNGLVDRAAAYRAGIGWWGRNANLLVPGSGSWFVLGSIVTDVTLPPVIEPVADGCRSCRRCVPACPTGAIVDDGVIDARRCLAWLVQDTGMFPRAHRVALGDRLYGCDDCQDACPPGRGAVAAAVPVAVGRRPPDAWVDVLALLDEDDETLLDRYGRWYIPRRDPRYLRRNALVVLGNVGDPRDASVMAALERFVRDDDWLLRAHATWACARLGVDRLVDPGRTDAHPAVRAEAVLAPSVPRSATALAGAGSDAGR